MAKLSRPYLSQIENGTRPGSLKVLGRIALALSIGLEDLISTSESSAPELDETEIVMLIAFAKLNKLDRNSVLQHARALAQVTEMKGILT